ncbi:MAG: U32 family peptidase [Streptococcus sp.]
MGRCVFRTRKMSAVQLFHGKRCEPGACTHPCRWKYAVVEESRPGSICRCMRMREGRISLTRKIFV